MYLNNLHDTLIQVNIYGTNMVPVGNL